jgi:hypothetical protein
MRLLNIFAIIIVALFAIGLVTATNNEFNSESDAVETAIKNNDYEAWKEAIIVKLTKENFAYVVLSGLVLRCTLELSYQNFL